MNLQDSIESSIKVTLKRFKNIVQLSWVWSTLYFDQSIRVEESHKFTCLNCSGHYYKLKRLMFLLCSKFTFQNRHQNISVDASFMCLIQNEEIIMWINHKFTNSHTISGKCNFSVFSSFLLKSNIVANFLSNVDLHLKGYSLCQSNCTDSSGLRYNNIFEMWVKILRHLGGLTTSSLSANESNYVIFDGINDVLFVL